MPTRTATVSRKLAANGQMLHRAMMSRIAVGGADAAPSEEEAALIEERKQLKEEREKRKARALLPRPSALDRLVRTHHPVAKQHAKKEHAASDVKKPKAKRTRAEKHAEKAAAIEAARTSHHKKPAK